MFGQLGYLDNFWDFGVRISYCCSWWELRFSRKTNHVRTKSNLNSQHGRRWRQIWRVVPMGQLRAALTHKRDTRGFRCIKVYYEYKNKSMSILLEFPFSIVQWADTSSFQPPWYAMEMKRMVADAPGHSALVRGSRGLICLAFYTKVHNMISADGAVVHYYIPCPKCHGRPFFHLKSTRRCWCGRVSYFHFVVAHSEWSVVLWEVFNCNR